MILKEPPPTRRSKVQDSTKSESSKQKPCGGKRKQRKRQINIGRNNKAGQNETLALQARYDELQRQEDDLLLRIGEAKKRDQRTGEARTTRLFATIRIRKHRSCHFSRVT